MYAAISFAYIDNQIIKLKKENFLMPTAGIELASVAWNAGVLHAEQQ